MDLLDQALENSQDKDGECSSPTSSEAAMVAAETCLVVEGGRQVLAMVDDDDQDGGRGGSDDDSVTLHRPVVVQGRRRVRRIAAESIMEQEQFELRSESGGGGGPPGTVTYRVVQVAASSAGGSNSNDELDTMPQIMSSSGNYSAPPGSAGSGVQAVLTSPLNGQFYVIGSPQEVFGSGNQRNIAPRSSLGDAVGRGATRRDERRRATHNEVERRRRDKINNWIMKLGKIIPDCTPEQSKQGQVSFEGQSKGGILAKACEYIVELRTANQRMGECMKESERLAMQVESLRQQNEELRRETSSLRSQLQQNGIAPISGTSPPQRPRDSLSS